MTDRGDGQSAINPNNAARSRPGSFQRPRPRPRGYTLLEMLVALVVTGVLLSIGVPQFQQSLEQSRADVTGANLRAIWSAQRLYWLQNRTYAPDLNTLLSANLIDPTLTTATTPYSYAITADSSSDFTATATRGGSTSWNGSFAITSTGTITGSVAQSAQGVAIVPRFQ
jgi:prepilin-type N-terminal cleavage/methylation domain-containing protein